MSLDRPGAARPLRPAPDGRRRSPSPATTSPTASRSRTTRSPTPATPRRSSRGAAPRRAPRASRSPASTPTPRRRAASGTGSLVDLPADVTSLDAGAGAEGATCRATRSCAATTAATTGSWAPRRRRATRCTATTSWCTRSARTRLGIDADASPAVVSLQPRLQDAGPRDRARHLPALSAAVAGRPVWRDWAATTAQQHASCTPASS